MGNATATDFNKSRASNVYNSPLNTHQSIEANPEFDPKDPYKSISYGMCATINASSSNMWDATVAHKKKEFE